MYAFLLFICLHTCNFGPHPGTLRGLRKTLSSFTAFLDIYPNKLHIYVHTQTWTQMFTAVLSKITKGVSKLLAFLHNTGRRRVVLRHTLNTLWHVITKMSCNVLSKYMILCGATFTAILGCVQPMGHGLATPASRWLDKLWCIQTTECYSVLKRNELWGHEKT